MGWCIVPDSQSVMIVNGLKCFFRFAECGSVANLSVLVMIMMKGLENLEEKTDLSMMMMKGRERERVGKCGGERGSCMMIMTEREMGILEEWADLAMMMMKGRQRVGKLGGEGRSFNDGARRERGSVEKLGGEGRSFNDDDKRRERESWEIGRRGQIFQ